MHTNKNNVRKSKSGTPVREEHLEPCCVITTTKLHILSSTMTFLRTAVVALLALGGSVNAFAPPLTSSKARPHVLHMADKKEDPTLMKSVLKKQIAYDSATGRFFETNISEEDCIPDEEFCMTDNDSGELIRLTQEEKERIFLDALQVRTSRLYVLWDTRTSKIGMLMHSGTH